MSLPDPRLRIDERVLGAGTSVRFATLLFLLLAASGSLMLTVISGLADGDEAGCDLAAGVDPGDTGFWSRARSVSGQAVAYRLCMATWAPAPSWWQVVGWPVLLTVSAGLLFRALPLWKARRSRVVPLEAVDPDGELRDLLDELSVTTGVRPMPRVVVDPAAASVGAVVFGRTRRPVVCLHGGLLASRRTDPQRFRAVLLHELAHVANRDVTLTYAIVALWRVFLTLVLLPYVLWQGYVIYDLLSDGRVPRVDQAMLLSVLMVVLLYLMRSDALRSREVYADLTAARWGADPRGWAVTATPPGGPLRRSLTSFLELWRTHPHWGLRQGALADPAPLFRVAMLPLFLTGIVSITIEAHVQRQLAQYYVNVTANVFLVMVLIPAALVTGVAGVALWRAVAYAVLTGSTAPSGAWAGGWLGAGMAAGTVLNGYATGWAWLPQRPAVLLVPVAAGAAFGWWVTQCAQLWTGTWGGRTLRPVLMLSLGAAFLTMASWLVWWLLMGAAYAGGFQVTTQAAAQSVLAWLPSAAPVGDLTKVPGINTVHLLLSNFSVVPLVDLTATALWVVPLLAWTAGPRTSTPRWMRAPALQPGESVAPLRKVVLPGLLGGALAALAVVGVQAYVHTGQPVPDARGGLYALRYTYLLLLALAVPSGLAAGVASTAAGRLRLAGGLIAAQTATLLGLIAMTVLVSVDGCVDPLSVLTDSCAWRPAWRRPLFPFLFLMNNALVLAVLAAAAAALAAVVLHRVRAPRPRTSTVPRSVGGGARTRCAVVSLLCVVAVGASATSDGYQRREAGFLSDMATTQRRLTQMFGVPDTPVSDETRVDQVHAWYFLNGNRFLDMAASYNSQLTTAARGVTNAESWSSLDQRFRAACVRWREAGVFEAVWFRVPDRTIEADWNAMATRAERGSRRCTEALDAQDKSALVNALRDLVAAGRCRASVNTRIDTLLRDAGLRGTNRPRVTGVGATCDGEG